MILWNNDTEIQFFTEALKNFASPEKVFYKLKDGYFAYIPVGVSSEKKTLQSRNSLIGHFTENWARNLFDPIAKKLGLFAVSGVACDVLGLSTRSRADLAFCNSPNTVQKPENIKLIFEIKMSVVSNYQFNIVTNEIKFIGDYKSHIGQPSFIRSDSMLKAIGKSITIRVSGFAATKIPIIIIGNSPIAKSYQKKVDFLKTSGVIQGFWSLNPRPTDSDFVKVTPKKGFQTIQTTDTILQLCKELVENDMNYFSSMISKNDLGKIISIASKETTDIAKAEKFLTLIRS